VQVNSQAIDGTAVNNGVVLATRDYGGNGPDVLFLPGGGQTLVDGDLLAPYLTQHHRVVAMDLRGHGLSDDGPFGWEAALDDVDAVITATGLRDPAVIGHSLGGMIAALHGGRHPEALGVVNIDGHGGGRPDQFDGVAQDIVAARLAELDGLREAQVTALRAQPTVLPEGALDMAIVHYQALYGLDETFAREALTRAHIATGGSFRPRVGLETTLEITQQVEALDFRAVYQSCKAPLLVYNATQANPAVPGAPEWMPDHLAALRRGLSLDLAALSVSAPNLTWIDIDATHALIYEKTQLLAEQIVEFLARQLSRADQLSAS
jgi:pimeloyl-ACP methyl ester carboxylesterase